MDIMVELKVISFRLVELKAGYEIEIRGNIGNRKTESFVLNEKDLKTILFLNFAMTYERYTRVALSKSSSSENKMGYSREFDMLLFYNGEMTVDFATDLLMCHLELKS